MDKHTEADIREARELLEECGYVSFFVGKDAEWGISCGEVAEPYLAIQISGDFPVEVENQIMRIKQRHIRLRSKA